MELYWSWQEYELSPAAENIGFVREALAGAMQQNGWEDVAYSEDVHGYKPGIPLVAAILFLFKSGSTYWQIIAVGGSGSKAQALEEIAQIQQLIANLHFL